MIGERLGHYEVLAEIGRGGMGQVYRARDTRLGREVALKLLHPELACDAACRARFEREARSVAALKHPNIVTVYAVEQDGERHFLAMELVEGVSLRGRIQPGGMSLDEVRELALPVCAALSAAHAKGIIHCDLKPGNIMLDERGQVKILDFGLARAIPPMSAAGASDDTVSVDGTITGEASESGRFAGTLAYMSPEQLSASPLGPASDIFSLGVLLFEMVTGERPFTGPTVARLAAAILREEMPALTERGEAAAALAPVIRRCLEKDPARRFSGAAELREALASLNAGRDPSRLAAARAAFAEQDWQRAHELLRLLDDADGLAGDDLMRLAEVSYWLGDPEEMARSYERAFAEYMSENQRARAGHAALYLAEISYRRLAGAVAKGWLGRAERILGEFEDTPEFGHLLRYQTVMMIESAKDHQRAIEMADRVLELGRKHGDSDLVALGVQDRGRALVALGQVAEGMALLDEVMIAAVAGELSPMVVGTSYCNMISSCHALADYRRAGEWSVSGVDWCKSHADTFFPGICRVYRAEVRRLRGAWAEAEAEVHKVCQDRVTRETAAAAFYEIGEIRLRMGDMAGAEEAFRQSHQLGMDPMPGLAALRLAQGRSDAARELLRRSLASSALSALDRVRLLPVEVEAAIAAGDQAAAGRAVVELQEASQPYESPVFTAVCEQANGLLRLAAGDLDAAADALERSLRLWTEADLPYESARVRALLAMTYLSKGNREAAELEATAARAAFQRLGAQLDLQAAETLPGGSAAAS